MNTTLNHINLKDWPKLASDANWSVSRLAKKCQVSARTLERHFVKTMGKSPKAWLSANRQQRAVELLRAGNSVKETAACLGFKRPGNFSREFTKYWGCCPTGLGSQSQPGEAYPDARV